MTSLLMFAAICLWCGSIVYLLVTLARWRTLRPLDVEDDELEGC